MITVLALIVAWNVWPLILLQTLPVPRDVKNAVALSFLRAGPKGLAIMPASLLAPLVVPIALLFTPRSADKLPWLFTWWDNDVSINGDRSKYWDPAYDGTTYYANAHPRSFWARFVWLGWRNRASRLAQMLGHRWADKNAPTRTYGRDGVGRAQEGWEINEREGVYQLVYAKRFGRAVYELHWGHKVWSKPDGRSVANVVNLSLAVGPWVGAP